MFTNYTGAAFLSDYSDRISIGYQHGSTLQANDEYVTITYSDHTDVKEIRYYLTVKPLTVEVPMWNNSSVMYNYGKPINKEITSTSSIAAKSDDAEALIRYVVNTGTTGDTQYGGVTVSVSENRLVLTMQATDVGTYGVTLKLNDSTNYVWVNADGESLGSGDLTYDWNITSRTIQSTEVNVTVNGWAYGDTLSSPSDKFVVTVDKLALDNNDQITYHIEGNTNRGTPFSSSSHLPTEAGSYTVYVSIDFSSENYVDVDSTSPVGFVISKRTIIPSDDGYSSPYVTGGVQFEMKDSYLDQNGIRLSDVASVSGGPYMLQHVTDEPIDVTLQISNFYNNQFESESGEECKVSWYLIQAINEVTITSVQSLIYGTDSETDIRESVNANALFGNENIELQLFTDEACANPAVRVDGHYPAGDYYIRAYVEGNDDFTSDYYVTPFKIDQKVVEYTVSLTTDSSPIYYALGADGKPVSYDPAEYVSVTYSGNDRVNHHVVNSSTGTDVGTYPITFQLNNNYKWADKQEGVSEDDPQTVILYFIINKAQSNTIILDAGESDSHESTYDARPLLWKPKATSSFGTIVYQILVDGVFVELTNENAPCDAKTYTIRLHVQGNNNYPDANLDVTQTINPLAVGIPSAVPKEYTGSSINVELEYSGTQTLPEGIDLVFELNPQSEIQGTVVGTYGAEVRPSSNYVWADTETREYRDLSWVISKRTIALDYIANSRNVVMNEYDPDSLEETLRYINSAGASVSVTTEDINWPDSVSQGIFTVSITLEEEFFTNNKFVINKMIVVDGQYDVEKDDGKTLEIHFLVVGAEYSISNPEDANHVGEEYPVEEKRGDTGKVYDGSPYVPDITIAATGEYATDGEVLGVLSEVNSNLGEYITYYNRDAESGSLTKAPTDVGSYTYIVDIPGTSTFGPKQVIINFVIVAKPLVFDESAVEKEYEYSGESILGKITGEALSGLIDDGHSLNTTTSFINGSTDFVGVTEGNVTVQIEYDAGSNYLKAKSEFTTSIVPKELKLEFNENATQVLSTTYTGNPITPDIGDKCYTLQGVIKGDSVAVRFTLVPIDENVIDVGKYYILPESSNCNYTITINDAEKHLFSITPVTLTKDAVQYTINTNTADESGNPIWIYEGISKVPLTVQVNTGIKNDESDDFSFYIVEGGKQILLEEYMMGDSAVPDGRDLDLMILSKNYDPLTIKDITVVIKLRPVTISAVDIGTTYGTTIEYPSIYDENFEDYIDVSDDQYDGFATGESIYSLNWTISLNDNQEATSPVDGNYAISLTLNNQSDSGNGIQEGNYIVHLAPGKLTVNRHTVNVLVHDMDSPYETTLTDVRSILSNGLNNGHSAELVEGSSLVNGHSLSDVMSLDILYKSSDYDLERGLLNKGEYQINVSYIDNMDSNYNFNLRYDGENDHAVYEITPKQLNVSMPSGSNPFNGSEQPAIVVVDGGYSFVLTVLYSHSNADGSWSEYNSEDVPVHAGVYRVQVQYDDENYSFSLGDLEYLTYTITPATLGISNVTYEGLDKTYDGEVPQISLGGTVTLVDGTTVQADTMLSISYSLNEDDPRDVGSYSATIELKCKNSDYAISSETIMRDVTISPMSVTPTWIGGERVYSGSQGYSEYICLIPEKDIGQIPRFSAEISSGQNEFKNVGTYSFTIELTGDKSSNFILTTTVLGGVEIVPLSINLGAEPVKGSFGDYRVGSSINEQYIVTAVNNSDINVQKALDLLTEDVQSGQSIISFMISSELENINGYVTVHKNYPESGYAEAVQISYSGDNFTISNYQYGELNIVPRDITVNVHNLPEDENNPIRYSETGISFDSGAYDVTGGTLDLYLGIRVVHGSGGVSLGPITSAGSHDLTAVYTDDPSLDNYRRNFSLTVLDGKIWVESAINGWSTIPSLSPTFGWEYTKYDPADDVLNWLTSNYGVPIANIYDQSGSLVASFTESTMSDVDFKEFDAGTYKIRFEVEQVMNDNEYYNYTAIGESKQYLSFTVLPLGLEPVWSPEHHQNDGNPVTVTLSGYDSDIMNIVNLDDEHPYSDNNGTITMTASESGTYGVLLILDGEGADNYCWVNSNGDALEVTWSIDGLLTNEWATDPEIQEMWVWGDSFDFTPGDAKYGTVIYEYYYRNGEQIGPLYGDGTQMPSEVGTFALRAYVDEGTATGLEVYLPFEITKRIVPVPEVDELVFAHQDGEEIVYEVEQQPWFDQLDGYVSYAGNTGSMPGNYTLMLYLSDADNTAWDTGSAEPLMFSWSISSGEQLEEGMFSIDLGPVVYNGHPIEKDVNSSNLVEGEDYVVSYSDNIGAGTATITITGVGAHSGQVIFEFVIQEATEQPEFYNEQLKMYVEDSSFYNALQLPSYIDESLLTYTSSDPSIATVDPHTGAITMNATGSVTITASYPGTENYSAGSATYELTVSDTPAEVVDHVVYIRVPVTDPDDPDDPTDDKPEEPAIVYKNDNTLYIILLLVLAAVCVCFAAYIMYTHRKQEDQGGGQR